MCMIVLESILHHEIRCNSNSFDGILFIEQRWIVLIYLYMLYKYICTSKTIGLKWVQHSAWCHARRITAQVSTHIIEFLFVPSHSRFPPSDLFMSCDMLLVKWLAVYPVLAVADSIRSSERPSPNFMYHLNIDESTMCSNHTTSQRVFSSLATVRASCLRHMYPSKTSSFRCSNWLTFRQNWIYVIECWRNYNMMFPLLCREQPIQLPLLPIYCSQSKTRSPWSTTKCGKFPNCNCSTICNPVAGCLH